MWKNNNFKNRQDFEIIMERVRLEDGQSGGGRERV